MYIELTPEQRKLQDELREYFSTLVTPEEAAAMSKRKIYEGLPLPSFLAPPPGRRLPPPVP